MAGIRVLTLAGQPAVVMQPHSRGTTKLLVVCHGAGTTFEWAVTTNDPGGLTVSGFNSILYYLAERDYTVVCPALWDVGLALPGHTFGNDVSVNQLEAVIAAAQALTGVQPSGKIALAGQSMGNVTLCNYIRQNGNGSLAGLFGLHPVADLAWQYTNNGGSSSINAALGIASVAGCAPYDPMTLASSITVPWRGYYVSDDGQTLAQDVIDFAALIPSGNGSTVNLGVASSAANNKHNYANFAGQGRQIHEWLGGLPW